MLKEFEPIIPLENAEVREAMSGLEMSLSVAEFQGASGVMDGHLLLEIETLIEQGFDFPEAVAAMIAFHRMCVVKAERLKETFENERH